MLGNRKGRGNASQSRFSPTTKENNGLRPFATGTLERKGRTLASGLCLPPSSPSSAEGARLGSAPRKAPPRSARGYACSLRPPPRQCWCQWNSGVRAGNPLGVDNSRETETRTHLPAAERGGRNLRALSLKGRKPSPSSDGGNGQRYLQEERPHALLSGGVSYLLAPK